MTNLVSAYQNNDITEFEKLLRTNRYVVLFEYVYVSEWAEREREINGIGRIRGRERQLDRKRERESGGELNRKQERGFQCETNHILLLAGKPSWRITSSESTLRIFFGTSELKFL